MITPNNQHAENQPAADNQQAGGILSLAQLKMGGRGRVVRVTGTDKVSQRLLEMGITPGAEVCLLRAAPLGDPLEIEIRGYRLSLRRSEAEKIDMESW